MSDATLAEPAAVVQTARFVPNVFILGAAKCATTAIHTLLARLSGTCMSEPKEPFFFECEFERGLDFYRSKYFGHWRGEAVVGEARHRNLYLPYVASRIHAVNPEARLIASLRNPIERAYSHWWHWTSRGKETASFGEAIASELDLLEAGEPRWDEPSIRAYCAALGSDGKGPGSTYVASGHYAEQLERYLRLFPREHLLVLRYEDLARSPGEVESALADFVGLDLAGAELPRANVRRPDPQGKSFPRLRQLARIVPPEARRRLRRRVDGASRARIDPATRERLREHYRPHNQALDRLLGWDACSRWR
jgi:Sulfotransferase domain